MLDPLGGLPVLTPSRSARIAIAASIAASAGDFLLLYVGNAQRPHLGLPRIDPLWLSVGGVLGVVAIPLYAFGYWSASRIVADSTRRGASALLGLGIAGSLVGGAIHGLTALYIGSGPAEIGPGEDPLVAIMGDSPLLMAMWAIATSCIVLASALFAWPIARGSTSAPRFAALFNPALLTIAIALGGVSFELARAFVPAAAPNLAHVVFFLVCGRLLDGPIRQAMTDQ